MAQNMRKKNNICPSDGATRNMSVARELREKPKTDQWRPERDQPAITVRLMSSILFQGSGIRMIDRSFGKPVYPASQVSKEIVLRHDNFLLERTGLPVSRRDFMLALTNVSSLLLRATYSNELAAIYR